MKLKEKKLRKIIRKEIRQQINEHTDTPEWQRLEKVMDKCIAEAERFWKHADKDDVRDAGTYSDMTGHKFEQKLRQMWNAFIAGDRNARRSDEIFK